MSYSCKLRAAYSAQRFNALRRGIGWQLTFEEWIAWWGDDIDKRGRGRHDLQMQRPHDSGPYALWNIVKGTPKRNGETRGLCQLAKRCDEGRAAVEDALDRAMWEESREVEWEDDPEERSIADAYASGGEMKSSMGRIGSFVKNKGMA